MGRVGTTGAATGRVRRPGLAYLVALAGALAANAVGLRSLGWLNDMTYSYAAGGAIFWSSSYLLIVYGLRGKSPGGGEPAHGSRRTGGRVLRVLLLTLLLMFAL